RRFGNKRCELLRRVDMRVYGEADAPCTRRIGEPLHARPYVVLQPVLRKAHERLRRESNVTDGVDSEQPRDERLETWPRQIGDVAAGDDHIANSGRTTQVS